MNDADLLGRTESVWGGGLVLNRQPPVEGTGVTRDSRSIPVHFVKMLARIFRYMWGRLGRDSRLNAAPVNDVSFSELEGGENGRTSIIYSRIYSEIPK